MPAYNPFSRQFGGYPAQTKQQPAVLSPADFAAQASEASTPLAWKQAKAAWQTNPYRRENPTDWRRLQNEALYGNPIAAMADTETAGPRRGLLGRVKQATRETPLFSQKGRLATAKIAAFVLGAQALGTVSAGAGGTAGATTAGGFAPGETVGLTNLNTSGLMTKAGLASKLLGNSNIGNSTVGGGNMAGTDFWKQAAVNTGANLVKGYLENRAQSKADKANRKAIEARIRQALANLSPEHIMALAQQFLPQMAANMSGAGQTAIQAVREQAARTGQLEGPRALSFEAGTRAKLAGDVQQAAFDRAFNLAGNQASAITGAPYAMQQPRTGYADAIANSVNQAYFARAMSQQPQQQGVPYAYPYNPYAPQSRNQGLY